MYFKLKYFLFIYFFCISIYSNAQIIKGDKVDYSIINNLLYLSGDDLQGRLVGSISEKMAAQYIKDVFESYDLDTICNNGYYHNFEFNYNRNPHDTLIENKVKIKSQNVVAYLNNNSDKTILIGAHYDHLGRNEYNQSLAPNSKNEIHNGADDNSSGVAGVLELAKIFTRNNTIENANYIFACFSGEETGLMGSKKLIEELQANYKSPITAMINMDMIGRMDSLHNLYIGGVGTSPKFQEIIYKNKPSKFNIIIDSSGIGPSDHSSFYLKNIPVLFFFTGNHSDYHKPSDDYDKINFEGLNEIINYINLIIQDISNEQVINFVKTEMKSERKTSIYSVSLGIMPNYVNYGNGLHIDEVIEGKIANSIGLRKGDIIVKLNNCEINDIYSYIDCLSKFKKGDIAKLSIIRDSRTIIHKIKF